MNEPVVPGGKRKAGDWLGPGFGGKHFVQFITLDQAGSAPARDRPAVDPAPGRRHPQGTTAAT